MKNLLHPYRYFKLSIETSRLVYEGKPSEGEKAAEKTPSAPPKEEKPKVTPKEVKKAGEDAKKAAAEKVSRAMPASTGKPPEKPQEKKDVLTAKMDEKINVLLEQKLSPEDFSTKVKSYMAIQILETQTNIPPKQRKDYVREVEVGDKKLRTYIRNNTKGEGSIEYGVKTVT